MENDGTFQCGRCRTGLNAEDRSCWRCGSLDIKDMRPAPKDELALLDVEEVLRSWPGDITT